MQVIMAPAEKASVLFTNQVFSRGSHCFVAQIYVCWRECRPIRIDRPKFSLPATDQPTYFRLNRIGSIHQAGEVGMQGVE